MKSCTCSRHFTPPYAKGKSPPIPCRGSIFLIFNGNSFWHWFRAYKKLSAESAIKRQSLGSAYATWELRQRKIGAN